MLDAADMMLIFWLFISRSFHAHGAFIMRCQLMLAPLHAY